MMLLHLAAGKAKATLVSLPRDSYVWIPPHVDKLTGEQVPARKDKLNTAYQGGPATLVQTIETATGVRIDHYVEINFAGFERMVNAVGGVEVCTTRALVDSYSGLDLPAGKHKLDGEVGLKYVRARHITADSDFGRIRRQQGFIGAIVRQATSSKVLLNPIKLNRLVNAVTKSVTVDEDLSQGDMLNLARQLRNFSPGHMTFATVPVADPDYRPGKVGSTVLWDAPAARAMFARINADQPINGTKASTSAPRVSVAPEDVSVQVLNGAGVPGAAVRAGDDLARVGFRVLDVGGAAATSGEATVIRYAPAQEAAAKTLKAAIPGSKLVRTPRLGDTVKVLVGSGWSGAREVRVVGATKPKPAIETATAAQVSCT
nr:LCP family protein [Motilibacter deserti]